MMTSDKIIRSALVPDYEGLLELFELVKASLNAKGLQQWPKEYPNAEQMAKEIELGQVYLLEIKDQLAGTFTLNEQQDTSYAQVNWKYNEGKTLIIHRLAILPRFQGMGLGRLLTTEAESQAIKQKAQQIRLDTWSLNPASCHLYRSLGYEQAEGLCYFHGHSAPFYCFEKRLARD